HHPQRVHAEPGRELLATAVWLRADLEHRRTDLEPRAGLQVLGADVEVDVDLVTGERPPVPRLGDERDRPRVHHRDLGFDAAAPLEPRIADETLGGVDSPFLEDLPFVLRRTPDDHLDLAIVPRRAANLVNAGFQRGELEMHVFDGDGYRL